MKIPLAAIRLPENDLRASIDEDSINELADSLRDHGQLQPIGVKPTDASWELYPPEFMENEKIADYLQQGLRFEVVFGARRTRAATILEWSDIEANIVQPDTDERNEAKKLIENVQRAELTPVEEAFGLAALISDGTADVRSLQRQTGKSREWIKSRLDLLQLPKDLQGAVQAGVLGIAVARELGSIEHDETREYYIQNAVDYGCTADQARGWAASARFAQTGIMSVRDQEAIDAANPTQPQIIEQKYHCFLCVGERNFRQINLVHICGTCQEAITSRRDFNDPQHIHIDHDGAASE